MSNLIIAAKLDSLYLRESDKRIFIAFKYYDEFTEMEEYIKVDITEELEDIYTEVEFDNTFVKSIERKLKLTLKEKTTLLKYIMPGSFKLVKSLCSLYSPNFLLEDRVIFNKPLIINATIVDFKTTSNENGFPLSGIIAECIIGEFVVPCKNGIINKSLDFYSKDSCLDKLEFELAYVDVDAQFEHIYNELVSRRCSREGFESKKKRLLSRRKVYHILANKLIGKVITLEYDEFYGFSFCDFLIKFIDKNYK